MAIDVTERCMRLMPVLPVYFGEGAVFSGLRKCFVVVEKNGGPGETDLMWAYSRSVPMGFTLQYGNDTNSGREYENCYIHSFNPFEDADRNLLLAMTACSRPSRPGAKSPFESSRLYLVGKYSPLTRQGEFRQVVVPGEKSICPFCKKPVKIIVVSFGQVHILDTHYADGDTVNPCVGSANKV